MKQLVLVGAMLFLAACSSVGPGEKGVRVTFGKINPKEILDSGYYAYFPFVTHVKSISTRVQMTQYETQTSTKDIQTVYTKVAINWHVNPDSVQKLFQDVGDEDDVVKNVIDPATSETLKAATAKMNAEGILENRTTLKDMIDKDLASRLAKYDIVVDDVSLTDFHFTEAFDKAVEDKQIAEQKSKQAQYDADRAIKEADAERNKAKGTADAQNLMKASVTKEILQQRAIEKWDGHFPQVMGGNGALPFININGSGK